MCLCFLSYKNGEYLAAGYEDGTVIVWLKERPLLQYKHHSEPGIYTLLTQTVLTLYQAKQYLISGGADAQIVMVDLDLLDQPVSPIPYKSSLISEAKGIACIQTNSTHEIAACGGWDGAYVVFRNFG